MVESDDRGDPRVTRLFRYILASDTGMAPCIDDNLMTLATCKPKIRGSAHVGDWIAGFVPRPYPRGLLAYAGRVRAVLDVGSYERAYRGRSDAIYREEDNGTFERLRPDYHSEPGAVEKDLSAPVLIFDSEATWFFGNRPEKLPERLSHLAAAGRPTRVHDASEADIAALETWLRSYWPAGIHGRPAEGSRSGLREKSIGIRRTCS